MNEHRTRNEDFRRNDGLEQLLQELNTLLAPVEEQIIANKPAPAWPVIFIVGSPRSGTTLLTQWLASLGCFAYPTNLLSRFYSAPYVGARIQQLLTDPRFQYRDEFTELSGANYDFDSTLGKTKGLLAPNEFWYFWRRFFKHGECHWMNAAELAKVDGKAFAAELAAMEAAFEKPLAMKGMIVNCNLDHVDSLLEKALFVYIKRKPFYNIQSLLNARVNYSGSVDDWYSFRPAEYAELRGLDPTRQVAGQIHYLNRAIERGLSSIDPSRHIEIGYESFTADPAATYAKIRVRFAAQGCDLLPQCYLGPKTFTATDNVRVDSLKSAEISEAWKEFSGEPAQP